MKVRIYEKEVKVFSNFKIMRIKKLIKEKGGKK